MILKILFVSSLSFPLFYLQDTVHILNLLPSRPSFSSKISTLYISSRVCPFLWPKCDSFSLSRMLVVCLLRIWLFPACLSFLRACLLWKIISVLSHIRVFLLSRFDFSWVFNCKVVDSASPLDSSWVFNCKVVDAFLHSSLTLRAFSPLLFNAFIGSCWIHWLKGR